MGLWGILAPLGALVFSDVRTGIRWYVAFLVVFLGSGIAGELLGRVTRRCRPGSRARCWRSTSPSAGRSSSRCWRCSPSSGEDALAALATEQEKAENLLLNILPRSIAERLKAEPQTIADQFTSASILFADVVDFTPRSEHLAPAEVVGMLDHLFSHFDTLAERYGLEKIKTIGDCYMVAAGVPTPRPDHARALALMALDMVEAMRPSDDVGHLGLELRVGHQFGPGRGRRDRPQALPLRPVGRRRQHGEPHGVARNAGRIQITGATYELLGDEFDCEPRGTIAVKGKGEMETWYVLGQRPTDVEHPAVAVPVASGAVGG